GLTERRQGLRSTRSESFAFCRGTIRDREPVGTVRDRCIRLRARHNGLESRSRFPQARLRQRRNACVMLSIMFAWQEQGGMVSEPSHKLKAILSPHSLRQGGMVSEPSPKLKAI